MLPVGGGSVIDSAKAIAMGVPYEGDFWDFYPGKSPSAARPVGTVLTFAGMTLADAAAKAETYPSVY